jgi:sulfur carrier protein
MNSGISIAPAPAITLTVNGEPRQFSPPLSCAGLIAALGLTGKRVALECNGEIVPRGRHGEQALGDGDRIEIVVAVGGG